MEEQLVAIGATEVRSVGGEMRWVVPGRTRMALRSVRLPGKSSKVPDTRADPTTCQNRTLNAATVSSGVDETASISSSPRSASGVRR